MENHHWNILPYIAYLERNWYPTPADQQSWVNEALVDVVGGLPKRLGAGEADFRGAPGLQLGRKWRENI